MPDFATPPRRVGTERSSRSVPSAGVEPVVARRRAGAGPEVKLGAPFAAGQDRILHEGQDRADLQEDRHHRLCGGAVVSSVWRQGRDRAGEGGHKAVEGHHPPSEDARRLVGSHLLQPVLEESYDFGIVFDFFFVDLPLRVDSIMWDLSRPRYNGRQC